MKRTPTVRQEENSPTEGPVRQSRQRSGIRTLIRICLTILLTIYVAICLLLFLTQGHLIFSGRRTQGLLSSRVNPPPGAELISLTTRYGNHIVALYGPALRANEARSSSPARRTTVLYFYGNGMCLNDCLNRFNDLRRLGMNVLIPEYVGYGMSDGSPDEANCYATATTAYDYLLTRKDIDPHRIAVVGWSLGGAVAIDLASRRPVLGLATFSTFSSMRELAHRQFPYLPTSLLLAHRFLSDTKMSRINCPILLSHGTADRLIPFAMMGQLRAAARGHVTCLPIEGAGHSDIFKVGGKRLLRSLGAFLYQL